MNLEQTADLAMQTDNLNTELILERLEKHIDFNMRLYQKLRGMTDTLYPMPNDHVAQFDKTIEEMSQTTGPVSQLEQMAVRTQIIESLNEQNSSMISHLQRCLGINV